MSSVLVTGAGGFVGGALAHRCLRDGHKVVGLFRDKPADFKSLGVTFNPSSTARSVAVFGDVQDIDFVHRVIVDYQIDAVYHLAAEASVGRCHEYPAGAYASNVMGTVGVLEACRRGGNLRKIVMASTDKVYGDGTVPYREDQPLIAKEVYSSSKAAADIIGRSFFYEYGLPVVILRSCNVFGPGDLDAGRLFPGAIRWLLRGEPAFLYEGAEDMIREFVYIDDEVSAYLLLAEKGEPGQAYNVGSSGPVCIGYLIRRLAEMLDGAVEVRPRAFREIPNQYMDYEKITRLGWSPEMHFWEGVDRTVEWWRLRTQPPAVG